MPRINYSEWHIVKTTRGVAVEKDGLFWNPKNSSGWRVHWNNGERNYVSITSFGYFGSDIRRAEMLAKRWCKTAKRVYKHFCS